MTVYDMIDAKAEVGRLNMRVAELEEQNQQLLAMLRDVEWVEMFQPDAPTQPPLGYWEDYCPHCYQGKPVGHSAGCDLAKLLTT